MDTSLRKMHPLMVVAAGAVILTCLVALLMMVGVIPTPGAREAAIVESNATTTQDKGPPRVALNENRTTARTPAPPAPRERTPERNTGSTASPAAGGSVGSSDTSERRVAAVCNNCGTVTSVRAVKQQGEAGLVGPIAGGALGGVVGSQIGGGSGKTIATIVGAAGGAAVGTEVERRYKSTTSYVVGVRLNDGTTRSFTYGSAPGVDVGDKVKVVDGRLHRDS